MRALRRQRRLFRRDKDWDGTAAYPSREPRSFRAGDPRHIFSNLLMDIGGFLRKNPHEMELLHP